MILRVGLTGGIASGKSTVGRILAGLGCVVIDADHIVSDLYQPEQPGWEALVRTYGRDILLEDGQVDRPKLASRALASTESTKVLNGLIHPLVLEREEEIVTAEEARFPDQDRIVVSEATLLLEAGGKRRYDRIVVVDSPESLQIRRSVQRGLSEHQTRQRISRQMRRDERVLLADYVISNEGDMASLEVETRRVWEQLQSDLLEKAKTKKPRH